jgi:SpoIID/LytB domain protein
MLRRQLIAALVGVAMLSATPALAGDDYNASGSGWGHQVGMSQYGAQALAIEGRTAAQITSYYYPGTVVGQAVTRLGGGHWLLQENDRPVWIGLLEDRTSFSLRGRGTQALNLILNGATVGTADPGVTVQFSVVAPGMCQFFVGGSPTGDGGPCSATVTWAWEGSQGGIEVLDLAASRNKFTRGVLQIRPRPGFDQFHVVLTTGLENYLLGISEVPASWRTEALRAQVLAARSYAVSRLLARGPAGALSNARKDDCWCNLKATTVDQNYIGLAAEHPNWVQAVVDTAGGVIVYPPSTGSGIIAAFYSSSSGGHTDSDVDGFGGGGSPLPYTPGVPDPWSLHPPAKNPYASWDKPFTGAGIAPALGLATVTRIRVTARNNSGTVKTVTIDGTLPGGAAATVTRTGTQFKVLVGMRSTTFSIDCAPGVITTAAVPALAYTDVGLANPHFEDIGCIASLGVTSGTSASTFSPWDGVPRWQMAIFLVRTAQVLGVPLPSGASTGMTDLGGLSPTAVESINRLIRLGISSGTSATTFDPHSPVTRWQMAIFLVRLYQAAGKVAPAAGDQGFGDLGGLALSAVTAINQLAALGVTSGTAPAIFGPHAGVQRAQMATFLTRLIELAA